MKRVLEYKLPMWGISILAFVALASAYVASIAFFFSFYTPALPSDIPRPAGIPITQIVIMVYIAAMAILDLILTAGLLIRWNTARIITIILSPAPVIGIAVNLIYNTLANQLIATGQPGALIPLQPLSTIASLLLVTGISFPSIAPVIGRYDYTSPAAVVLALLNVGTIIYLSNNHIKAHFRKQNPRRIESTGV